MKPYDDESISQSILMGKMVERARLAHDAVEHEVWKARQIGMSWAQVGMALGTSAQAAWEKYAWLTGEVATRSGQNLPQLVNEPFPGIGLPPEPAPKKRGRQKRGPRGQADK